MVRRIGIKKLICGKTKRKRFLKHNSPKLRKFGWGIKQCSICGGVRAHIDKYGLNICRRCFREVAFKLGFKKMR